jgi:hypothetical protein
MNFVLLFFAWCIVLILSWPIAIVVLILAPIVWLISLPLRLIGITVGAAFALVKSLLYLPARLLGHRG